VRTGGNSAASGGRAAGGAGYWYRTQAGAESRLIAVWNFLRAHKKCWRVPIIVLLVIVGLLFVVSMVARITPVLHALL